MISYNKIQRRNPLNGNLKWYPNMVINSNVTADDVILGIVEKCTLTKVDVKAVLIALEEVIIEQMKNGNTVRFGSLGSFRPTLKIAKIYDEKTKKWIADSRHEPNDVYDDEELDAEGKPVLATRGVSVDQIAGINVCFTKSGEMCAKLDRKNLKFKLVDGVKRYPQN